MSRPDGFVHDDKSLCAECNHYGPGGHATWCASYTPTALENDRWWQAFAAPMMVSPPLFDNVRIDENRRRNGIEWMARLRCDFADEAINEARKRGRL